jgi:DNA polymerase V
MSIVEIPQVLEILKLRVEPSLSLPLIFNSASAGFPSPADDYIEKTLNLNEYLIQNDTATFFMRVSGESMIGAGIFNQDVIVVDRSMQPQSGDIVVATVNNDLTVKKLLLEKGKVYLVPENPAYEKIEIQEFTDLKIWGVVTGSVKKFK